MDDDGRCPCGEPSEHEHHLTGRGHGHAYLDPDLTVPLCHDDHNLIHEDLREAGVDNPTPSEMLVERVEYRLRRLAIFFSRLAQSCIVLCWIESLARAVASWADDLRRHVRALDTWNPKWRLAGGT